MLFRSNPFTSKGKRSSRSPAGMTLRTAAGERELRFPFEVNGVEYQIREASRCVAEGRTASPAYPPASSIALAALTERIRAGWGMRFDGEG